MSDGVLNFDQQVIERSHDLPVLVDFWAQWCGPCKSLGPVLEKIAAEAGGAWELVKIDVDANEEAAGRYQVRSIPAVMLFVAGEQVAQFTGALPESEVRTWLGSHLPSPSARQLTMVERLLAAGEFDVAEAQLEELVAADPQLPKARVYLAQRKMLSDPAAAVELVAAAGLGDDLFGQVENIRHIGALLLRDKESFAESRVRGDYLQAISDLRDQQPEAAIEGFIRTLMFDRDYDDEGARKSCIAILDWWGEADGRARGYRQKMQRALN